MMKAHIYLIIDSSKIVYQYPLDIDRLAEHITCCCCSVTKSCNPIDCNTLGFPVHHQLQELAQTHVHQDGDAIQPSHPLSSPSPPAFNLSHHQGLFQWSVLCIRWPKCWSFSFSISPSNEYSGLISFRIDCFDLLAVQGTLGSLLQHHTYCVTLGKSPTSLSLSKFPHV